MDPQDFEVLIRKLDSISSSLDKLAKNKPQQLSEKDITTAMVSALETDKDTDKMSGREKKKIQKIAKIFKKEFEELDLTANTSDKQEAKDKTTPLLVTLDKKSFKGLEKTLKTVLPDFFDQLSKDTKKAAGGKGGIFSFLGDIVGGVFGAFGALNKIIPFLLAAGGLALAFYIVKNIEKIAKAVDLMLTSGKENLPTIADTLSKNILPFLQELNDTIKSLFDRLMTSLDNFFTNAVPKLLDIFLTKLPVIRETVTGFAHDLIDLGKEFNQLTIGDKISAIAVAVGVWFAAKQALGLVTSTLGSWKGLAAGGAFLLIAEGLKKLAESFAMYQDITWETIGKGAVAIAGLFAALTFTSKEFQGANLKYLLGFFAAGGMAFTIVKYLDNTADALTKFQGIDWETLGKGGVALTALFGGIAAARLIASPAVLQGIGIFFLGGAAIAGSILMIGKALEYTMDSYYDLQALFEKYSKMDGSNLISVAGGITALFGALTLQSIGGFTDAVVGGVTKFMNWVTGKESPYETIKKYEQLDGDRLNKNAESIKNLFKAIGMGGGDDVKRAIENLNNLKLDRLGNITAVAKPTQPGLPAKVQQDFISRPNQPPIAFSSQDTVVAFKKTNIFDSIEGKIDSNYRKITEIIQKTLVDQQKLTESNVLENRKHTELLGKLVSSNETMADQAGPGGAFFNSSVNNNIINVDSYTASTYRSRLGRSPGMPA